MSLEGEVYVKQEPQSISNSSTIISGEFLGWISLTTDDFQLSDSDIDELVKIAHIKQEFSRTLLSKFLSSEEMEHFEQDYERSYVMDDIWFSGHISRSYLQEVLDD